jgi:pyrimidine-nucleoside phosphorylase
MIPSEVKTLTQIYIESGVKIEFPESLHTVDKHSTGGVGDKITIPLAPIVAACGVKIPMISGRGLGHTGGTLDKLESIPGFRTDFSVEEFKEKVNSLGLAIVSQSKEMVPADKRIYALRDVTGTVESLPLITASIMSKKIAEGAQNLVIDLKVGTGAFIKDIKTAKILGNLLKDTGEQLGQKVTVVYTNMNSPLGFYIGNALEIKESIEYLKGADIPDIDIITRTLAKEMLILSGNVGSPEEAEKKVNDVITSGKALEFMKKFIESQGGNPAVCDDLSLLPQAKYELDIISDRQGWIKSINSQNIGYALVNIGAGRKTLDSVLDYSAGAYLTKKIGDTMEFGEVIGKLYCNDKEQGVITAQKILDSYEIIDSKVEKQKIIFEIQR